MKGKFLGGKHAWQFAEICTDTSPEMNSLNSILKIIGDEGGHSSGVEGPVKTGLDPGPKGDLGPKEEQDPEDQDPEISSDPEDGVA